jgi:hypothetical protein
MVSTSRVRPSVASMASRLYAANVGGADMGFFGHRSFIGSRMPAGGDSCPAVVRMLRVSFINYPMDFVDRLLRLLMVPPPAARRRKVGAGDTAAA